MLLVFARETIPAEVTAAASSLRDQLQGYWQALRDKPFIGLVGAFTLVQMTTSLIWVLLSVYVKTGFGISEQRYGWLATTNALMVVFLQVMITRQTQRHPALKVMRWGQCSIVVAPLLIAFSTGYWGFWLAMVVMTWGIDRGADRQRKGREPGPGGDAGPLYEPLWADLEPCYWYQPGGGRLAQWDPGTAGTLVWWGGDWGAGSAGVLVPAGAFRAKTR